MKKIISLILVFILCTVSAVTVSAFEAHTVYMPHTGCRIVEFKLTKENNPWLLWDVTFSEESSPHILISDSAHPNLVGCSVIPTINIEGDRIEFNGRDFEPTAPITIRETNTLSIINMDGERADYIIRVTEETNGLPVVLINTEGVPISTKTEYVDAHISVLGSELYNGKDIYNQLAGIKLRGNTTMGYDKKPYRIKFDKKQDVLGMGSAKSWVLLAGYLDPSFVRNQATFLFADDLYEHTLKNSAYKNEAQLSGKEEKYKVFSPRMKMVEVYLNGEFKGLYDMGDHMQANEIRVNIDESGDEFEEDANGNEYQVNPEANVGYFIEVEAGTRVIEEGAPDSNDWSEYSYITNVGATAAEPETGNIYYQWYMGKDGSEDKNVSALYFQFKLPEKPSAEQIGHITSYLQEFNDKLLSDSQASKEAALKMIDVDSFVNWYLINEIFRNPDSQMQSSCYFYKDKDGVLYMAPVWDFDISAGAISFGDMADVEGWRTRNDEYCGWFRELFETESFKKAVIARWRELHDNGILNNIFANIDNFRSYAKDAADANIAMWQENYFNAVSQSWMMGNQVSDVYDWDVQLDYLEAYLKARIAWMDSQGFEAELPPIKTMYFDSKSTVIPQQTFWAEGDSGSVTYDINMNIPGDLATMYLNMNASSPFNIGFNMEVTYSQNGEKLTESVFASVGTDWYTNYPFSASYNSATGCVDGGVYTDAPIPLISALDSTYNQYGRALSEIYLKSITVDYTNASYGAPYSIALHSSSMIDTDSDGIGDYPDVMEKYVLGGAPTILGKAEPGRTLVASSAAVTPRNPSLIYQWYRNNVPIMGATSNRYTVTDADIGAGITVRVTGSMLYAGTLISQSVTVAQPKIFTSVNP